MTFFFRAHGVDRRGVVPQFAVRQQHGFTVRQRFFKERGVVAVVIQHDFTADDVVPVNGYHRDMVETVLVNAFRRHLGVFLDGDHAHLVDLYLGAFRQFVAFCKQVAHLCHTGALQHGAVDRFEAAYHIALEVVDLIRLHEGARPHFDDVGVEVFNDRITAQAIFAVGVLRVGQGGERWHQLLGGLRA